MAACGLRTLKAGSRVRGRKPSWIILSLGFGGLLLFLLAAASGTLIVLDRARAGETRMRRAFLERLRALDQIRGQIYLSGTYVRDFLLSPDLSSADSQSARISALEQETHRALDAYSRSLELEERQPFSVLRSEIDGYWRVLDRTISWSPEQRSRLRYAFFYNELMPRRTAMLQIADRIAQVNEQGLNRAEEALAASSGSLRRSLLVTFGIVLAGGLLLAVMTIGYTVHLEKELQHRFAENTRSKTDLEDLSNRLLRAQEDERRTLARELHDQVGQSLSAILMEAGNAECAEQGGEQSVHLNSIRRLAEHTASEVRDLALLLRPSMLDDFGLVPALNWYSREMAKRTGLKIVLSADESANQLPGEHTTCIYRVVQEGVNNAARHAQARTIEVVVARNAHRVAFSVQDDGAGFDSHMVRGLGLLGMEERVRRLGGVLRLDSQPGRGTRISAELPVIELAHRNGNAHSHTAG